MDAGKTSVKLADNTTNVEHPLALLHSILGGGLQRAKCLPSQFRVAFEVVANIRLRIIRAGRERAGQDVRHGIVAIHQGCAESGKAQAC